MHTGGGELAQRVFGYGFEMVGGGCAQFGGKGCAGAGAELLGVDAQAQTVRRAALSTVQLSSTVNAWSSQKASQ